jgi:type I restriction enzyme M protein
MNLDLRGIEADFGHEHANTLHADLHPELCDEYVLANSPFKDSDWFRKDDDVRCICCDVILPMSGGIAA